MVNSDGFVEVVVGAMGGLTSPTGTSDRLAGLVDGFRRATAFVNLQRKVVIVPRGCDVGLAIGLVGRRHALTAFAAESI